MLLKTSLYIYDSAFLSYAHIMRAHSWFVPLIVCQLFMIWIVNRAQIELNTHSANFHDCY